MPVRTGPNLYGHPLHHVAYCVDSLDEATERWAEVFGAGPFFHLGVVSIELEFEGAPATFDHRACFGAWGPINVELIEPLKIEPAEFGVRMGVGRAGPAHYSYLVDDLHAELARLRDFGFELIQESEMGPVHVIFVDNAELDICIELHKRSDFLVGFHDTVSDAAIGWDGKDVLRRLDPPGA